jgi:type IV secretory pathway TrbD component
MALMDLSLQTFGIPMWVAAVLIVWSLVWKGLSMWKAAKLGSKPWFIALLVLNTAGILDILYIYVFARFSKK